MVRFLASVALLALLAGCGTPLDPQFWAWCYSPTPVCRH